ncbi:hypothetical protein BGX38DRAFT_1152590 [Terfezia claveryi]|nr:hypothetical protein BGX38DRAFT_1152590 [Terfezia claveryi]
MGTNSQDATTQWPDKSISAQLRYYPVHQAQADLDFESTRLFAPDDSERGTGEIAAVEACKVGSGGSVVVDNKIRTHARLDQFLRYDRNSHSLKDNGLEVSKDYRCATLFILFQQNSRAKLEISYDGFRLLLNHMNAFPEISEIVKAFGQRTVGLGVEDESWAGYYSRINSSSITPQDLLLQSTGLGNTGSQFGDAMAPGVRQQAAVISDPGTISSNHGSLLQSHVQYHYEVCYILRHVERAEMDRPNSWTIRKTAFYQKFSSQLAQSHSLLIEPSTALQQQLATVLTPQSTSAIDFPKHWTTFPMMCLGTISINWRTYINFMSSEIEKIHTKFKFEQLERLEPQISTDLARVTFTDLRTLQTFVDKGLHSIHVLDLNSEVLQVMLEDCEKIKLLESQMHNGEVQRYHEFQDVIQTRHREQLFCKKSLQSICDRAERISRMIGNTIALRDSSTMRELTQISGREAVHIHALTEKTVEDTRAMKLLTLMALLYLPASFTAGFFGMGYVTLKSTTNGGVTVHSTDELWFYLAITIPLMFLTCLSYFLWGHLRKRRARREYQRETKDSRISTFGSEFGV